MSVWKESDHIMSERIEKDGKLFAIIARRTLWDKGTNFVTDKDNALQLGVIVRDAGYVVEPHIHPSGVEQVPKCQTVFHVESGQMLYDVYDDSKVKVGSALLNYGDTVIQFIGGHKFMWIRFGKLIEVKIGRYEGENKDKVIF